MPLLVIQLSRCSVVVLQIRATSTLGLCVILMLHRCQHVRLLVLRIQILDALILLQIHKFTLAYFNLKLLLE